MKKTVSVCLMCLCVISAAFSQEKNEGGAKPPIGEFFTPIVAQQGVAAAIAQFRKQKSELGLTYTLSPETLRAYGIALYNAAQIGDALAILKLTVEEYPQFARAHYSLGYVYREAGHDDLAIACFEKSLALDAGDTRATDRLSEMRKKKLFSAAEVKQDLAYLYQTLADSHYDLYMHTKKAVFDAEYDKIQKSIRAPRTVIQIERLFAPLLALSRHSHCRIENTGLEFENYRRAQGTVFPFNVYFSDAHVLIDDNYSQQADIARGDEILAINGKPIAQVMTGLYRHLQGENRYSQNTIIESIGFPVLYWFVYAEAKSFDLRLKKNKRDIVSVKIAAITVADFYRKSATKQDTTDFKREFRFIDQIAYLRPGAFYNINAKNGSWAEQYGKKEEFRQFLQAAFTKIAQAGCENLIVDLRNSPGGDDSFSAEMVAYFANKPFYYESKFCYRTSRIAKEYWKNVNDPDNAFIMKMKENILAGENGARFEEKMTADQFQPRTDSLHFKGHVFILINRYSYSATTSAAAMIQDFGFAYLIGEETADLPSSCGATQEFTLPHTGIVITYPKGFTIRPSGDTAPRGTRPDFAACDDVLTPADEILDFALRLIKEKKYTAHKLVDRTARAR